MDAPVQPIPLAPSAAGARHLRRTITENLIESFHYLFGIAEESVPVPKKKLGRFYNDIRAAKTFSADVFGLHNALVFAVDSGDEARIEGIAEELISNDFIQEPLRIFNFTPEDLGERRCERYRYFMDIDPEYPLRPKAAPQADVKRLKALAGETFDLMRRADPELYGEIETLTSEFVLTLHEEEEDGIDFNGVSSVYLWGAVFFNTNYDHSLLDMYLMTAHECTHVYLFGHAINEPLVLNPDNQRFQSPLRNEPRPMDGIFHATYVVARMHHALETLLNSRLLSDGHQKQGEEFLAGMKKSFLKGCAVLDEHGDLTPLGHTLMSGAREYMHKAGVR